MTVHRPELSQDGALAQAGYGGRKPAESAIQHAQEEDRARIAQTIHDHFGFLLTLLRMRLQSARNHVHDISGDETISASRDTALAQLTAAEVVWQQLLDAARQLQNDLCPAPLDNHGLGAAFVALQKTFAGAGLTLTVNADALADKRFGSSLETTAYWLTQHALTNVLRHSGTHDATVTVDARQIRGREALHIVIEDRGKGFTVGQVGSTFGLTTMYDRAALVGGTVVIDSAPGLGTRVIVDLPTDLERGDGERDPSLAKCD